MRKAWISLLLVPPCLLLAHITSEALLSALGYPAASVPNTPIGPAILATLAAIAYFLLNTIPGPI